MDAKATQTLDRFALSVSALTSPFAVLAIFPLWVMNIYAVHMREFLLWAAIYLIFVLGVPVGYIILGVYRGTITDVHIMLREQRLEPLMLATISSVLFTVIMADLHAPIQVVGLGTALVINGLAFTVITYFWKISIHSAAWGGSTAMLAVLFHPVWWWLLLGIPVIIWARNRRKRHTVWQGLAATATVIACTYLTIIYIVGYLGYSAAR